MVDVWVVAGRAGATEPIVRDVLGSNPEDVGGTVRLSRDHHGRLQVGGHDLTLSVSHTEAIMLVAVGRGCRVGVDIEPLRDRRVLRLPEHALTAAELEELRRCDTAGRLAAFLSYWVRKEALLKAAGFGLAIEPASIEIPPPGHGRSVTSGPSVLEPIDRWSIVELELDGYAAAVAADVPAPSVTVRQLAPCANASS